MRTFAALVSSIFAAALLAAPVPFAAADAAVVPELYIREVKVTGDEFVVLQASADIPDLSAFWVGYSSNELQQSVVPTQQLPARALLKDQAIVLTSDGAATCDAVWITKLSAALGDTRGVIALRKLVNTGSVSTFTTVDMVNWTKPPAGVPTTAGLDMRKETADLNYPVWYQDRTGVTAWRVGDMSGCVITLAPTLNQPAETVSWEVEGEEPPAIIESLADEDAPEGEADAEAANPGMAPPQITELLPNPMGTGTDGTEEFIELYNSNEKPFNLAKFVLQTGLSTKHSYTFPAGTMLPAKSFRAFYASETKLSMSNTGSQATLLDPTGAEIASAEPYTAAKDGMAWARAQGSWYWTNRLTPNDTNVIVQVTPSVLSASAAGQKTAASLAAALKTAPKAAKAKVTKSKTAKKPKTSAARTAAAGTSKTYASVTSAATKPAKIHWGILAAVALGALGYGLYGYRHDLANKLHDIRANRSARRAHRP